MSTVRDVLAQKGEEVVTLAPDATVLEAAHLMNDRGIGAVLVLEDGHLRGIFTERDVLRRIVAAERAPGEVRLGEVMTTALTTCDVDTSVEECATVMTTRRIRHLPVLGPGAVLQGLVSIGDVVAWQATEQRGLIVELNRYIYDIR